MKTKPVAAYALALIAAAAIASASCSGAQNNCDPVAIVAHGKCFLDKDRACDEIGCVPPNECIELDKSPPEVECRKAQ